jgi:putative ABC transport system permease protein
VKIRSMAWRNVWRNRRRSLVTIAAMSLALLILILYAGLMEGYLQSMEHTALDLEVGDVQVFAADYRDNPSLYTRIEDPEALLRELDAYGYPATPRLLAFGLAASGDSSAGASLRGLDVARDARVSFVYDELADGAWLDGADPKGVVLGRRLARSLGAKLGDEILILSQGGDGSMAYDLFRVRGVLRGIGDATDRTGVFMLAASFRELMVVPDGVHQIIVRRPAEVELPAAAERVRGAAPELDVKTWRQLMPTLASMMDSARGAIFIMFFIIYIAIGILMLNAMLMAVFERIREIGVLKALGAGPLDVLRLIAAESALQTGIALVIGLALGVPGLLYLERVGIDMGALGGISVVGIAMETVWRAAVTQSVFVGPVLTLVVIVSLAVTYPALKGALIEPVEAMRQR